MRAQFVLCLALFCASSSQALDLKAKSALIVDDRTGIVLYGKDADAIRFPASITKILTAILLVERTMPETVISAPFDTKEVEGASLHLKPWERVTSADMLKAILLRSANDACHAIAVHIAGSDAAFARLMNQRAKQIGCERSNFTAPHGLHNDSHFVTAREMGMIAREAMKFHEIRSIVDRRKAKIARSINTKDTLLVSKNKWLDLDPSAEGIKTGYTKAAGATFVGAATRNGFRIVTVILNSEDWVGDQQKLVKWAYKYCTRTTPIKNGDEVGAAQVFGGSKPDVRVAIRTDIQYAHRIGVTPNLITSIEPMSDLQAPVRTGDEVGVATFEDGKGWVATAPVFAVEDVESSAVESAASPIWIVVGLALGGSTIWARRKSRQVYRSIR